MEVWVPNSRNRLEKVLLGSVPSPTILQKILGKSIPKAIERVLIETREDLDEIKKTYESLDVEVISSYPDQPESATEDSINVRDGFIVVDDHMFITKRVNVLENFYDTIQNKTFCEHLGRYCPDIYINDDYAILDRLDPEPYRYWRRQLSGKRQIITAFNEGHSDGIYCNVADKIWLTNGKALPFEKYWPKIPVMELSKNVKGEVNDWDKFEELMKDRELEKTKGGWFIYKHELSSEDIEFTEKHLENWTGYCEETLFDINMSIIDENNVMAISQNSLVYEKLESLGIKVHKVPFRHRFFWDGGLHCITNDLVRAK
tara:strand:- start:310 stop:1257 length:948 start_codon:yes stop_codon:yes gene_type:complete